MDDIVEQLRQRGNDLRSHPVANGTIECTEQAGEMLHEAANEIGRLRASIAAIHCRVCHGWSTYGMVEAITSECEHAVPVLKALRRKP